MKTKKILKTMSIYILLFSIVPISLYINFFIAEKTIWDMHIKAWIIYSSLIMAGELLIIIFFKFFISKLIKKFNLIPKDKRENTFINLSITAFLLGNIFFIIPIHAKLFFYTPVFQGFLIFVFLNIYLKPKTEFKRTWIKKFFTVEKKSKKTKSNALVILIPILIFTVLNTSMQFTIHYKYKPYIKALDYSMPDGYKIKVSENPYEVKLPF